MLAQSIPHNWQQEGNCTATGEVLVVIIERAAILKNYAGRITKPGGGQNIRNSLYPRESAHHQVRTIITHHDFTNLGCRWQERIPPIPGRLSALKEPPLLQD
jgi:hypothetical protein